MENFNIENAKTRFFESKEHYLNFRQAWKDFHNNEEHIERGEWTTPHGNVKEYKTPLLSSSHYMLYNLLRGYDIKYGYTPLQSGKEHLKWDACNCAASDICRVSKRLEDVNSPSNFSREYARREIDALLLPFGGHVTHEALRDIGEQLNINVFNNQNYPQFEVEKYQDIKEPEQLSFKEKLARRFA
jgi:hypothetical protein